MIYLQIMSTLLKSGLKHVQSYISPLELKALDKKANFSLRSRSDMIRIIVADALTIKN